MKLITGWACLLLLLDWNQVMSQLSELVKMERSLNKLDVGSKGCSIHQLNRPT